MSDRSVVAVLGAGGTMGMGMAVNIARAGLPLVAWNRTREKTEPLAENGARIVDTPAEAGAGADVIVTMLTDGDAVLAAMQGERGALARPRESCVWVQMSTIGERATQRCIELAQEAGVGFVDAPVSGTKQPAAEGKLVVLASGPLKARGRVQPVFDAVGQRTLWVSDRAGAGTRLKLVTNAWLVAVAEGMAETIALAEGLGLDPALFLGAIEGGPLDAPYARMKAQAMIDRDFAPAFALKLATKDAMLAVESAREHDLDLPVLEAISERMQQAVPEHGDEDLSATYLTSAPGVARSSA